MLYRNRYNRVEKLTAYCEWTSFYLVKFNNPPRLLNIIVASNLFTENVMVKLA